MEDKQAKILIVDDEPEIVSTLKHFFSNKGYEVSGAIDGKQALDILEKEEIGLILLDIMMPGITGSEIAKFVKTKYPSIKLIVVTGYPEEGQKLAQETILDGLFIKPVGINELYVKLLDVLGQRDISVLDTQTKQGIRARVLLIKAKLLFVEPSLEIYQSLSSYFKELASKGENYELEVAGSAQEATEKLMRFHPDLLIVNTSPLGKLDTNFMEKIYQSPYKAKETIIYNLAQSETFNSVELEKLVKSIQIFCLKNGLLEIKWIEI
jgi:CheY-like chemotaxis protein